MPILHKTALPLVGMLAALIGFFVIFPTMITRADTAGYALEFDGNNDYVVLPETLTILGEGWEDTKSVELWVLPYTTGPACIDVAGCDLVFGDRPRWWGISHGTFQGQDRLWVWNQDASGTKFIGIPYTPGAWVHITMVHAEGILSAFKNGVEVGHIPSSSTLQPDTGALPLLHLGGMIKNSLSNWTFAGQLDEVRLWNITRSASELQQDLYHTIPVDAPGLAAYYQMSDGSGLILTDDTGLGNTGTLHDGDSFVPPDGHPPTWVLSTAFDGLPPATPTFTFTPEPPTSTPVTPTATFTFTPEPPTSTPVTPTATFTFTPEPPTSTPVTPTATFTFTPEPPTSTPETPTATYTFTPEPPTATATIPVQSPTPTATDLPPTPTPTATTEPVESTPTFTPTPTETPVDSIKTVYTIYLPLGYVASSANLPAP